MFQTLGIIRQTEGGQLFPKENADITDEMSTS